MTSQTVGRLWKTLELWTKKLVDCYKQSLRSCWKRSLENSDAEISGVSADPAHEVPGRSKDFNINWARCHSCDTLAKNLVAFCTCPKNLPECRLKSNELISLVEGMSRQHNVEPIHLSSEKCLNVTAQERAEREVIIVKELSGIKERSPVLYDK